MKAKSTGTLIRYDEKIPNSTWSISTSGHGMPYSERFRAGHCHNEKYTQPTHTTTNHSSPGH